ncbi:MAG: hypothetical protein LBO75_00905 [Bifidobacteriaceae bacterium]|nr:hypothetical protein [Bifidobacteriaceae bacterium]
MEVDSEALASALTKALRGPVEQSSLTRCLYSSDASNYRVIPQVVVFPESQQDLAAVGEVTRQFAVPLTLRGAGTSCAGNAYAS